MGRHSTGDQRSFYRSAVLWFLPWTLFVTVAAGALWIAVDALEGDAQVTVDSQPTPSLSPTEEPTASDEKKNDGKEKDEPALITEGITIQVLNGSSDPKADEAVVSKLEGLGYDVAVVNAYSPEEKTVVMWSSVESKEAAKALAEHFGWGAKAKTKELSSEVSIHVLIGEDAA